jgi:hypothetical protein
MSKYQILPYSYEQAKKLDVVILPSSNPKKKIDVYQKIDVPPLKYSSRPEKIKKPVNSKKIKAPLGDVPPSLYSNPTKKIKNPVGSKKVAVIGAYGYPDYPTYMKTEGKEYADERRRLYKARHNNTRMKKGSASWWADKLLW